MAERITYYSSPDTIYDENVDIVKGTSLTGSEVDMNFNTLEGRCIKNISLDGNILVITLLNGNEATCNMAGVSAVKSLAFDYDREHGTLLVFVNGHDHPIPIEGFISENDFEEFKKLGVLSDDTIVGNGTQNNPLSLSPMFRPGMLRPVNSFVTELPESPETGDRYIDAEEIDTYGALYNYKGVLNIMEHLEGTGWHVATKDDWDDMLNALEPELADRNHHLKECNVYLGESANYYLDDEVHNFNAVMCGYAYDEESLHVVFKEQRTAWWTASHDEDKNAYIKRIDEYADGVFQDIVDGENFYSVRLVRDITPNEITGPETILGKTYMTTQMPSETKGLRLWTATNYTSDLTPITSESTETTTTTECNGTTTTVTTTVTTVLDDMSDAIYRPSVYPQSERLYFVNEWNGRRWIKRQVNLYDSFYVKELGGFYYMTEDGLISIYDTTPIDIGVTIAKIESDINSISRMCVSNEESIEFLTTRVNSNIDNISIIQSKLSDINSDIDNLQEMSAISAGQASIAINTVESLSDTIEALRSDVDNLKQLHIEDLAKLYAYKATSYNWAPTYDYYGTFTNSDLNINYVVHRNIYGIDHNVIIKDFNRFFTAIHIVSSINTLVYKSNSYIWSGDALSNSYIFQNRHNLETKISEDFGNLGPSNYRFVITLGGVDFMFTIEII